MKVFANSFEIVLVAIVGWVVLGIPIKNKGKDKDDGTTPSRGSEEQKHTGPRQKHKTYRGNKHSNPPPRTTTKGTRKRGPEITREGERHPHPHHRRRGPEE